MTEHAKELLEKQLQLLSERSQKTGSDSDLAEMSLAMMKIAEVLVTGFSDPLEGF